LITAAAGSLFHADIIDAAATLMINIIISFSNRLRRRQMSCFHFFATLLMPSSDDCHTDPPPRFRALAATGWRHSLLLYAMPPIYARRQRQMLILPPQHARPMPG